MIELRPGLRLRSAAGDAEVVVVRGAGEADLCCGGAPMIPAGAPGPAGAPAGARAAAPVPPDAVDDDARVVVGKRYAHAASGTEVLCTKPGAGALSIGVEPFVLKSSKALPASD